MIRYLYLFSLLLATLQLPLALAEAEAPISNTPLQDDYIPEYQVTHLPFNRSFPTHVTLRAAVLTNTVPLAYYDNATVSNETFPFYRGFQPDLMRRLVEIAKSQDNITLEWQLEQAKAFSYSSHFELMANDCNSTENARGGNLWEDCNRLDLVVGDYYGYPSRSIRTLVTPPLLTTAAATVQYAHRKKRVITTLREAVVLQEPVCLLDESHYDDQAVERFPGLVVLRCFTHRECLEWLKSDECALFVEDELQLRYLAVEDAELIVTRQTFDDQFIVWPLNARLDPLLQQLIIRWIYQAKVTGVLDALFDQYFNVEFCPLGSAGQNCELNCSSAHGSSDRYGNCVCESTSYTGDDCETRVEEELNLIPLPLKIIAFVMVALNFTVVGLCGLWLFLKRNTTQVRVSQPIFLSLILLGCFISTSTIFALAQEDEGSGPVPGCMAIPWLYSVGFSITFGSLFAKIRRVFTLFQAAEQSMQDEEKSIMISTQETFSIVFSILLLDITLLTIWTIVDPLQWMRDITSMDKFGASLESEGYCSSEHWVVFAGIMAALHLGLMLLATYMCYRSRLIPTQFQEGRYLSIAMVSNLQIFSIGLPVLVILGSDPASSFFVRSAIIWMNDLVVVTVIFGNIILSHYKEVRVKQEREKEELDQIKLQNYHAKEGTQTLVSNMLLQS